MPSDPRMTKAQRRLAIAVLKSAAMRYRTPNVRPEWVRQFADSAKAMDAAIKALRRAEVRDA